MKTIRSNVFETNSSSTHAIAFKGKDSYVKPEDDFQISTGEYGWEHDMLYWYTEKLSYVVTMIQYKDSDVDSETPKTILDSKYFIWLQEMIVDYCGHTFTLSIGDASGWYPLGYIDHQSDDTLDDFWSEDEQEFKNNMKELIFNEKYYIITDNDNH